MEHALRQVVPGRYDAYEALLRALADGQVWMLLWHGSEGSADAQYGNMEIRGFGYAPCVTSARELSASGWNRSHELVAGREIAASLFPDRWGLWLNPHASGGGVGVPWADLRRITSGLDRLPAGPLRIGEPSLQIPQYYALLSQAALRTPAVRGLWRAWVQPAVGEPYLAIGLDMYDTSRQAVESVRVMMQQSIGGLPEGLPVSTVAMGDEYDPVAMWMRGYAAPFFDRESHGSPAGGSPGYPPPLSGAWAPATQSRPPAWPQQGWPQSRNQAPRA